MTSDRRFEQDLQDLMAQLAPQRVPDYRDDVVRQAARTRQRPAWSFPERWLPVDITLAPTRGRSRSLTAVVVLAIIGVLVAGLMIAYIGSRPVPVPAPFGPAANGQLFYDSNGQIIALDSVTATPRTLIKGSDTYTYPLVSRDGQLIQFDHTANGVSQLYVAKADGSNVRPLAGTYRDWTWTDWSTDSKQVGIVSSIAGSPSITILDADGSGARTLDLRQEVMNFWYMADGRIAFLGSDGAGALCRHDSSARQQCGLFVVNADGTGIKRIVAASELGGFSIHPSPDGRSLLYVKFIDSEPGGLHIIDVDTGVDHRVAGDTIPSATLNVNNAWFSPDGTHILFDWLGVNDNHWGIVPVAGGPAVQVGPAWTPDTTMPEAAYSPDGMSIIAAYPQADGTTKLWLLDPTGQKPDQPLSIPATYAPAWQRVGL